ncbi:hypothetical protein [Adhaeribacter aquaticus]|uniref:hypothetical protein n=1 Tax=Adhaeribacter aquaticus TaxID=299567 RepID=UPI00047A880B|nr:hypothetical protein [Adhaeribacter aquaticus]
MKAFFLEEFDTVVKLCFSIIVICTILLLYLIYDYVKSVNRRKDLMQGKRRKRFFRFSYKRAKTSPSKTKELPNVLGHSSHILATSNHNLEHGSLSEGNRQKHETAKQENNIQLLTSKYLNGFSNWSGSGPKGIRLS